MKIHKTKFYDSSSFYPCEDCYFDGNCPLENKPVRDLVLDDLITLYCGDLLYLYERFQEIGQKMKEKKCGQH